MSNRLTLACWDRVGKVRTTTHRSWFVTCEGADGRTVEPPPWPEEGKRRSRPRGLATKPRVAGIGGVTRRPAESRPRV